MSVQEGHKRILQFAQHTLVPHYTQSHERAKERQSQVLARLGYSAVSSAVNRKLWSRLCCVISAAEHPTGYAVRGMAENLKHNQRKQCHQAMHGSKCSVATEWCTRRTVSPAVLTGSLLVALCCHPRCPSVEMQPCVQALCGRPGALRWTKSPRLLDSVCTNIQQVRHIRGSVQVLVCYLEITSRLMCELSDSHFFS